MGHSKHAVQKLYSEFDMFKAALPTPECSNQCCGPLQKYWNAFVPDETITNLIYMYLVAHMQSVWGQSTPWGRQLPAEQVLPLDRTLWSRKTWGQHPLE